MSTIEFADGKPLTDDEIHAAASDELQISTYYMDDALTTNWEAAYGYYKGVLPGPTDTTRSEAVSTDVSDVVEWILPAILKPLVESPDVVRFDPVNPEDEHQAALESDYVHTVFMKRNKGFLKLYSHIKDALLLKVGVFCTYWDEGVTNQLEEYKNLTEVELADLLAPADSSEVRLVSSESRQEPLIDVMTGEPIMEPAPAPEPPGPPPGPPMGQQPQMDPMQPPGPQGGPLGGPTPPPGPPMPQEPPPPPPPPVPAMETLYDVSVRRFTPKGAPVIENCVPEAFRVRMTQDSIDLSDARGCSYSFLKSRAEVLAMGYDEDKVNAIKADGGRIWDNEVRWAREDVERERNALDGDDNKTGDPSQDNIRLHRVYMMLDADGDGHEEQYLIILAGPQAEEMLDYYEVPENPFSASTPFIASHKFYGYSLFDKVKALADRKSQVLRMVEDNLDLVNNPKKKVIRGQANLNDLLVSQPGAVWRVDTPDAVQEIPTVPLDQSAYKMLDYYDKMRTERVGVDPNAQSISGIMPEESMNSAVERVLSAKEELVGLIIRVFAETGVKDMFLKLRSLMLRNNPREELVQLRNKWTTVNPGNWIERSDSTVVVGLGTGDRIKKQNGLMQVMGMQKEMAQSGLQGIVISPERMSFALSEFVRVSGLGDPDDYFLDPTYLTDPRNAETPRGQEVMRAMQLQEQQKQEAQQAQQAEQQAAQQAAQQAQQAQERSQQMLIDLQREVALIQQQGKVQVEQLKEEGKDKDRMAEMEQFKREMRHAWAELVSTVTTEKAKIAANTATTLMQTGATQMAAEDAAERADKAMKSEAKNESTE